MSGGAPRAADWREMTASDIDAVVALADRVHPTFHEAAATFADRLALFPQGSLVLPDISGSLAAYAIAYPTARFSPPPLDTVLGVLAPDADGLYVHDVAVAPKWRGQGLAEPAIRRLLALSEPYGAATLVSVYGTAPFWARHGFERVADPAFASKLASYGDDAVFMIRHG